MEVTGNLRVSIIKPEERSLGTELESPRYSWVVGDEPSNLIQLPCELIPDHLQNIRLERIAKTGTKHHNIRLRPQILLNGSPTHHICKTFTPSLLISFHLCFHPLYIQVGTMLAIFSFLPFSCVSRY
jgi:hypothetical protein